MLHQKMLILIFQNKPEDPQLLL